MKTIGLLGGMSWESTERYYRLIVHRIIYEELCLGQIKSDSRINIDPEVTVGPMYCVHAEY